MKSPTSSYRMACSRKSINLKSIDYLMATIFSLSKISYNIKAYFKQSISQAGLYKTIHTISSGMATVFLASLQHSRYLPKQSMLYYLSQHYPPFATALLQIIYQQNPVGNFHICFAEIFHVDDNTAILTSLSAAVTRKINQIRSISEINQVHQLTLTNLTAFIKHQQVSHCFCLFLFHFKFSHKCSILNVFQIHYSSSSLIVYHLLCKIIDGALG